MDLQIFEAVRSLAGYSSVFDSIVVAFGVYFPYVLIAVAIMALSRIERVGGRMHAWVLTGISVLLARWVIVEGFRFFAYRARPFFVLEFSPLIEELSSSFPSAHASLLFALAVAVYHVNRRAGTALFIGACLNGIARVAAGVHWPSDIVGGLAVGTLAFIVAQALVGKAGKVPRVLERIEIDSAAAMQQQ